MSTEQTIRQLEALQRLSTGLFERDDPQGLYDGLLDAAVDLMDADFASFQVLEGEPGERRLRLLAHRNLPPEAAASWATLSLDDSTACSAAARTQARVIVSDVERSDLTAASDTRDAYLVAGVRSVQTTPLFSRAGELVGMVSTHWGRPHEPSELQLRVFDILARQAADLLERARWERELRTSEKRYRTLFESIDEGFCIIEVVFDDGRPVDYRFVTANPALGTHAGIFEAEGKLMREIAPSHEEHWFQVYGDVAQTGESRRFVAEAAGLGGRWFDVFAFPVAGDSPPHQVGVLFRDITEQRRTEMLRDQFLAIASHELRNPVSAVHGMVQHLRRLRARDELTEERLDAYLERLVTSSSHLARLTGELTDVSRLQRGALPLHIESVDVGELVLSVARSEEWPAERIEIDVAPDVGVAEVDPSRVRQVLGNLIENALKYSPRTESIRIGAHAAGDGFLIEIVDRGAGVPPDALETIFQPFGRAPNTRDVPGMGMGLSVSREIASRHGGRLWAESAGEGRGAAFRLWLPCRPSVEP